MRILEYRERRVEADTHWPEVQPGEMIVVMENSIPVMVEFICPCGCGRRIPLHLELPGKKGFPRWHYSAGPTLTPSIQWTAGCMAHFNITDGKVIFQS